MPQQSIQYNTTCDVYSVGDSPPTAARVTGVKIQLTPTYHKGQEAGEHSGGAAQYTHIAIADIDSDIRDSGLLPGDATQNDSIHVPNGTDTSRMILDVMWCEATGYGGERTHYRRIYLRRNTANYPTQNL